MYNWKNALSRICADCATRSSATSGKDGLCEAKAEGLGEGCAIAGVETLRIYGM